MARNRILLVVAFQLSALLMCGFTTATPSVHIGSPEDGAVLLTSEVVVSGTASGSSATWAHGGADDFGAGVRDHVEVSAGTLVLSPTTRDDFEDDTFDTTLWERFDFGGVESREESGGLHQVGTSTMTSYWGGRTIVLSKDPVDDYVEAYLAGCVGSGTGYNAILVLFQDDSNQAGIGIMMDQGRGWYNPVVYWGCLNQGVQSNGALTGVSGIAHVFKVTYSAGKVDLWVDGNVEKSITMTLTSPRAKIASTARYSGDKIDAIWGDFRSGLAAMGTYVSGVHDSGSVDPVLSRVDWNASTPSGTTVAIAVRSSADPDMSSATGWTPVTKGQITDLPGAHRYLQYRATLATSTLETPSLRNMTITYSKPVNRVEVSLDGANWVSASGTTSWSAMMTLPEGRSEVWARANDVAGDIRMTTIAVDVDTTPPVGSLVIDDGASVTANSTVTLRMEVSDAYGVESMLVSESPDFAGAAWRPFATTLAWTLSAGNGAKVVHARFRDSNGHLSLPVNDSITLDTTAPVGMVTIDDGAVYSRSREVTLGLTATDMLGVAEMRVWEGSDSAFAAWEDYCATRAFLLSDVDDEKAVHAEFRDPLGHVSVAVTDTIVLDTTSPAATVHIDDDAPWTNSTEVTLVVIVVEANEVDAIQLGEDALLDGVEWVVPSSSYRFTFSAGDGTRSVHVRARDAAGNVGVVASDDIVLDTTPPAIAMGELPRKVGTTSFNVTWSGSDATTWVATYDVQFRDGEGAWTDWFMGTNATQATFMGADGHSYAFRARARDALGNLGAYPDAGAGPVRVLVPVVTVTIDGPLEGTRAQGKVELRGTAAHTDDEMGVRNVSVSIDGGPWVVATGTTAWTLELDTEELEDGAHVVRAVASDGERRSQEAVLSLTVDNPEPRAALSSWLLVVLVVVAVAAGVGAYVWMRSRRAAQPPAGPPPQGKPF